MPDVKHNLSPRPTPLFTEKVEEIIKNAPLYRSKAQVARASGISVGTLDGWLRDNEVFSDLFHQVRIQPLGDAREKIIELAKLGHFRAAEHLLKEENRLEEDSTENAEQTPYKALAAIREVLDAIEQPATEVPSGGEC